MLLRKELLAHLSSSRLAPPPPSGSLGHSEDSEGGISGGELSQPPAWPQAASPTVHIFTGLTHSPPAGEGAERRKKGRNQGASERKERLVRGGGIIQKQHTCDIGPQNVGSGTCNRLETEARGWLGTGGQCRRAAQGSRALVPPFTSKHFKTCLEGRYRERGQGPGVRRGSGRGTQGD